MNVEKLSEKIKKDIKRNILQDETGRIFNEPSLIEKYKVTRYTLRKALNILVEQGIIYQVQGKGTFVRKRDNTNAITLDETSGFTEEARKLGKELKTIYAKLSTVKVDELMFLPKDDELSTDEEFYLVERLMYLDNEPFVLEYSYYRKIHIPYLNQEIIENSIYNYINKAVNVNPGFADKFIFCEACKKKEAKSLNLNEKDPVLVVRDEAFLNTGEIFNFSKLYYHPKTELFMIAKLK